MLGCTSSTSYWPLMSVSSASFAFLYNHTRLCWLSSGLALPFAKFTKAVW